MFPPLPRLCQRTIVAHLLRIGIALTMIASYGGLSGCPSPAKTYDITEVEVRRYRWYLAEDQTTVQVVGELENTGSATVAAVKVRAILQNSRGSKVGENPTVLKDLQPGEIRPFDVRITPHGSTETVILQLAQPKTES